MRIATGQLLTEQDEMSSVERLNREIRRAANSFLGITEVLLDTDLTSEQRKYVEVLRSATDRLLSVGGRIVRVSGNDLEEAPCHVQFDLRSTVEQTAGLMCILGAEKGVQILTDIAGGDQWLVIGDRERLEEVLVSVLSTFIKSVSSSCIRVQVRRAQPGQISFDITTPLGITAEAESSGDSQAELSIEVAAQTVKSMGGTLTISSTNQHTTGSCTIPLCDAVDEKAPGIVQLMAVTRSHPARVLLAEDSPDNQFTIRAYLKNQPYSIDTVDTGIAALDQMKSGEYSIILMDIEMPGMSGIEATKAIRDWERSAGRQATPIIALTAHSNLEDMNKCLDQGFTAYLAKPVRKQMILETLQRYLPPREN
jgi:CheY-like chemotaxis protein